MTEGQPPAWLFPMRAGAPARALLAELIRIAKGDDPLAPVTVAVPSNFAGLSLRRVLGAEPPGLVNVRFQVLARIVELLGAPLLSSEGRRPLTPWREAEAIRAALAGQEGMFAAVAAHPSTESALRKTFRELRRAPEGGLAHLADRSPRSAAVVGLFERYRRIVADFYDREDLAAAAGRALRDGGADLRDLGRLIVYLPRAMSPGEAALVRELAARGAVDVILGVTGDAVADGVVADIGAALGFDLRLGSDEGGSPPTATHILRAADGEEEVRTVVRLICADLEAAATTGAAPQLSRQAVLFPPGDGYIELVQEQFRAAGIATNGPPTRTLAQTVAGKALLGLLRIRPGDFRREDVMEWLAGGPIIETLAGEHAGRWAPTHRWDQVARDAGVTGGLSQWSSRPQNWARGEWRGPADMAMAERLSAFVRELAMRLESPPVKTMAAHAQWALGLLDRYLGDERAATGWGSDREAAAYTEFRSRLAEAAAAEPMRDPLSGEPLDLLQRAPEGEREAIFRQAMERLLESKWGTNGRFGEGVFCGPVSAAAGMTFDRVYMVGMVEGAMPAPLGDDPLLPREERELAGLPAQNEQRSDARFDYLVGLASAPERVLCFPQANLRGQSAQIPSRWLLESVTALEHADSGDGARRAEDISSDAFLRMGKRSWLTAVASLEQAIARPDLPPASEQEMELASLLRASDPSRHYLVDDRAFAASLEAASVRLPSWVRRMRRQRTTLSAHDGGLGAAVALGGEQQVSATPFETLAKCPFQYFLGNVLRIRETKQPEDTQYISPADRGNIVHDSLKAFFQGLGERVLRPEDDWTAEDHARLRAIGEEQCQQAVELGLTGSGLLWRVDRARILRDLDGFLEADTAARRETGATFFAAERSFGSMSGDDDMEEQRWPALTIDLPDGESVAFRGRIDRIDQSADGSAIIYDYKTGGTRDYEALERADADRLGAGTRLQLPIYALAARNALEPPPGRVEVFYWFASERERYRRIGYELGAAEELRLRQVLGTLSGLLNGGLFPAVPGKKTLDTFSNCHYCPYDSICPGGNRIRAWKERQGAEGLAPFLALTNAEAAPEDEEQGNDD